MNHAQLRAAGLLAAALACSLMSCLASRATGASGASGAASGHAPATQGGATATPTPAPAFKPVERALWYEAAPGIHVSVSAFEQNNSVLVVSEGKAAIIDTGYEPAEGRRILEFIQARGLELVLLVNTHGHPDHSANNALFDAGPAGARIPANTPDGATFKVGAKTLKTVYTPGHYAEGDMGILVEEDGVFIAGDIAFSCLPPQLSYGASPAAVEATLRSLAERRYRLVIPGHGHELPGDELFALSLEYIERLKARVKALVELGTPPTSGNLPLHECAPRPEWMLPYVAGDLHENNAAVLYYAMKSAAKK